MNHQAKLKTKFSDRQADAAEAKKALLAKFKPKPTVVAENLEAREERRAAELEAVRQQRAQEREAAKKAREEAELAARRAAEEAELAILAAKRDNRKERKAFEKATAQQRRASKYAEFFGSRGGSSAASPSQDPSSPE